MANEPTLEKTSIRWSEPVNGLSGRLLIEFEDLRPGLRYAVYLELKNQSENSIAVANQPLVHGELVDSEGKPLGTGGLTMTGPIPNRQWAVIPRDAYIGFRIDVQTAGIPTREQGKILLALGGNSWQLGPGKYVLEVSIVFKGDQSGPPNQWIGELTLSPGPIVVTPQVLRVS